MSRLPLIVIAALAAAFALSSAAAAAPVVPDGPRQRVVVDLSAGSPNAQLTDSYRYRTITRVGPLRRGPVIVDTYEVPTGLDTKYNQLLGSVGGSSTFDLHRDLGPVAMTTVAGNPSDCASCPLQLSGFGRWTVEVFQPLWPTNLQPGSVTAAAGRGQHVVGIFALERGDLQRVRFEFEGNEGPYSPNKVELWRRGESAPFASVGRGVTILPELGADNLVLVSVTADRPWRLEINAGALTPGSTTTAPGPGSGPPSTPKPGPGDTSPGDGKGDGLPRPNPPLQVTPGQLTIECNNERQLAATIDGFDPNEIVQVTTSRGLLAPVAAGIDGKLQFRYGCGPNDPIGDVIVTVTATDGRTATFVLTLVRPEGPLRWVAGGALVCDNTLREVGRIYNARPGEELVLTIRAPSGERIELRVVAGADRVAVFRFSCPPTSAGGRWTVDFVGTSGRTGSFAFTSAPPTPKPQDPQKPAPQPGQPAPPPTDGDPCTANIVSSPDQIPGRVQTILGAGASGSAPAYLDRGLWRVSAEDVKRPGVSFRGWSMTVSIVRGCVRGADGRFQLASGEVASVALSDASPFADVQIPADGLYFLRITSNGETWTVKVSRPDLFAARTDAPLGAFGGA